MFANEENILVTITPALLQFVFGVALIVSTVMSGVLSYHVLRFERSGRGVLIPFYLVTGGLLGALASFAYL